MMSALLLWLPLSYAAAPPCAGFAAPVEQSASTDASCMLGDAPAPNLVLGEVFICSLECTTPGVNVWIPVRNEGAAAAGTFEVRLYRRLPTSLSEIRVESVPALAAGEELILGPFTIDPQQWGTGTAEVLLDVRNDVLECDESGHTLPMGAFDGPVADADEDGYPAPECGGKDCNDADAGVFPGALDVRDDGIDQNCDGDDARTDFCDWDRDGVEAPWCAGGTDCNDADPTIGPGFDEVTDDGIDQDCDGEDACAKGFWVEGGLGCATPGPLSGWFGLLALLAYRRREVR